MRFWKSKGRRHFREEEEVLLPAYSRRTRLEENEIFPAIEAALSEDELRALAPHITRLHRK